MFGDDQTLFSLSKIRKDYVKIPYVNDIDPIETQDWLSAVDSLIRAEGVERAHYIINQVIDQARNGGVNIAKGGVTNPLC